MNDYHKEEQQIIALSAIIQAAYLVDQLAKTGDCDEDSFTTSINSLIELEPASLNAVYGDVKNLYLGLSVLKDILNRKNKNLFHIVSYVISLLHLEKKLSRNNEMLNVITQRISQIQRQCNDLEISKYVITENIASLYKDTISTIQPQVQVKGDRNYLTNSAISDKIRALLLAGIRSAVLWRQLGGSKWQLLTKKRSFKITNQIVDSLKSPS